MNNRYWFPLLLCVVLLGALGFGWYVFEKTMPRENTLPKGIPKGVPVSEGQKQMENKAGAEEGTASSGQDFTNASSASDPGEEVIEKAQPVGSDTSLDAISKELDQTNVEE